MFILYYKSFEGERTTFKFDTEAEVEAKFDELYEDGKCVFSRHKTAEGEVEINLSACPFDNPACLLSLLQEMHNEN